MVELGVVGFHTPVTRRCQGRPNWSWVWVSGGSFTQKFSSQLEPRNWSPFSCQLEPPNSGAHLVPKNFHLLFEHMYEALNVIK